MTDDINDDLMKKAQDLLEEISEISPEDLEGKKPGRNIRTDEEKLREIEEKKKKIEKEHAQRMNKLKEQEKLIKHRMSVDERKKDTHKKIILGGIVQKYCGKEINEENFEAYCKKYAQAIKSFKK